MKHLLRGLFIAVLFYMLQFPAHTCTAMQNYHQWTRMFASVKLDNGLTYYIRHNALPEKQVEFHRAQKVGSILEEPQQRGLAHFLEHSEAQRNKALRVMKPDLASCLVRNRRYQIRHEPECIYQCRPDGVQYQQRTDWKYINVVDSCLRWFFTRLVERYQPCRRKLTKERMALSAKNGEAATVVYFASLADAQSTLYPDSKYSDCMPIGSIDVINNFPYQDIRDYYAKWYRPDLQSALL